MLALYELLAKVDSKINIFFLYIFSPRGYVLFCIVIIPASLGYVRVGLGLFLFVLIRPRLDLVYCFLGSIVLGYCVLTYICIHFDFDVF